MNSEREKSPWICHVCDYTDTTESVACSVCYKVTCTSHLVHKTILNEETGLYEIRPICVECTMKPFL